PPGPPGVVIVEEITEVTATLSWTPGADNHIPEHIGGDLESATAIELNPWVEYEFRVVATNKIGTGDPSTPSKVIRTKEAVPKTAPANVSGRSGRRHELVIAWEPVSEEFQNGESFGYIVAFRPNGTRGWKEKMVTSSDASKFIYRDESVPPLTPFEVGYWKDMEQEEASEKTRSEGNESSVILTGLEGNTLYHLRVKAYNSAGYGPPSNTVHVATKKSRWPGLNNTLKHNGFIGFDLWQEGHSNSQVIETQKTSAVVLLPDVGVYIIEVCAVSEGGDGTPSSQIRIPSFSGGPACGSEWDIGWKSHKFSIQAKCFYHFFINCNISTGIDGPFNVMVKEEDRRLLSFLWLL
ncbi:Contactin-5, partial [Ophiophagus hannah]